MNLVRWSEISALRFIDNRKTRLITGKCRESISSGIFGPSKSQTFTRTFFLRVSLRSELKSQRKWQFRTFTREPRDGVGSFFYFSFFYSPSGLRARIVPEPGLGARRGTRKKGKRKSLAHPWKRRNKILLALSVIIKKSKCRVKDSFVLLPFFLSHFLRAEKKKHRNRKLQKTFTIIGAWGLGKKRFHTFENVVLRNHALKLS